MCKRIRQTNELLEDFTILDLRRRLAKRLIYLNQTASQNDKSGVTFLVHIQTDELIAMMGVNHDAIIKQLQLWDRARLIRLTEEWVVVLKQDHLTKIAREES